MLQKDEKTEHRLKIWTQSIGITALCRFYAAQDLSTVRLFTSSEPESNRSCFPVFLGLAKVLFCLTKYAHLQQLMSPIILLVFINSN